ncbi:MAG TPA: AMP-binding protein, partial [Rhodothermales bacterium]
MAFLLHQIVDQSAERAPASEAIRFSGQTLTYEALALESDRLARVLVEEGVQRGDRVGLYLGKGPASVIGLYGIMKAGAAYVPLDPGAPVARTAFVLNDCGICVVITEEARVPALRQMLSDGVGLECAIGIDPQEDLGLRTVSWSDVAAAPSVRERPRAM